MKSIRHRLLIEAPSEKIYQAITTQKGLSGWWSPDTRAKPEQDSVARFAFGQVYFKEMKITELQPHKKVKWFCITASEEWIGTSISFELQPSDYGTVLFFRHDDWKEYTMEFAACNYNWALFMRSLKLLCEIGKGKPFPNQHQ